MMTKYYPMTTNSLLRQLMSDPFESFFSGSADRPANLMSTDIRESDTCFQLDIDLPGFKKEDVNASLKDGYLTVSAKTATETAEGAETGAYLRKERFVGSCNRSFYVGEDIEQADIAAKFENGVLQITVPKKKPVPQIESTYAISIA